MTDLTLLASDAETDRKLAWRLKMKHSHPVSVIPLLFLLVFLPAGAGCAREEAPPVEVRLPPCDPDNGGITLPSGFCALVVADNLGPARHLTVASNGDVYVRLRGREGEVDSIVALRDTDGDGRADVIQHFGGEGGTGIRVHNGFLYFSTDREVLRYHLTEGQLVPEGEPELIVEGFPRQRDHAAKPFAFDGAGNVYVTSGAPSNSCMEQMRTPGSPGRKPCPELELHAGIWRYGEGRPNQMHAPENRYATGIRHVVALAWNPVAGGLYAVQHGRDQLDSLWPDLFTPEQNAELPAEEFLLLTEGSDFGWPYCYYDPFQNRRVLAPEYGGDGTEAGPCDQYGKPILTFPAHYAPNDLIFYTGSHFPERYRGGAFVAFHGSWNRAPLEQKGYLVAFVPFAGSAPVGDWEIFANGFAGVEPLMSPGDARFRPMGLAEGPDGSLYISDSVRGRVWRIIKSQG